MKNKKILIIFIMIFSIILASCSCNSSDNEIYYLNFKVEQDKPWQKIAAKYFEETNIKVNVVTSSNGNYETTLTSELNKKNAPTLFQINGEVGYNTWKDYLYDLSNTQVYEELKDKTYALGSDGVYAIGYCYESYGLIVNKELLELTPYTINDIDSYEMLEEVTNYITQNKKRLNFSAFTSSGLDPSSSWRYTGHLFNLSLYYEFLNRNIHSQPSYITGEYLDNYKNIWDLYINNSTVKPNELSIKTITDSLSEFLTKKACFYQNGTWEYESIKTLKDENIGFIPIYFNVDDKNQGFSSGCENYWVVNKTVSQQKIDETIEFLNWLVTDPYPIEVMSKEMGLSCLFKKSIIPDNVLFDIVANSTKENIAWKFQYTPNTEKYRSFFESALVEYSTSPTLTSWQKLKDTVVDSWHQEYTNQ